MNDTLLPISAERENHSAAKNSHYSRPLFPRLIAWCVTMGWHACVDWRTKRSLLTRATAHISIVALALATISLSGVGISMPRAAIGGVLNAGGNPVEISVDRAPTPSPAPPNNWSGVSAASAISRLPVPRTSFPERLRAQVQTYLVQAGDTIFDIASRFGLYPDTIVWSNREVLMDAPWLINPGLELSIPPVDGVCHIVRAGDTVASIAAQYEVEPDVIYNEWNNLEEGDLPVEGQAFVIPSGVGEEVSYEPPPLYPSPGPSGYSYGVCNGANVTGPGGNGWFTLPTGSYGVSGWYFHDPRNPTHIGLDYRCHLGDPIYAADNAVVTIAGWNGGYGIMVQLNHGNGFTTRYGHFDSIAVGCGHQVMQGDLIGYCGTTGYSSGPHLHFEIRHNGVPQDPMAYQP